MTKNKLNIAICNSNSEMIKIQTKWIESWSIISGLDVEIFEYKKAKGFLFDWKHHIDVDIVFINTNISDINWLDMAKQIREKNHDIDIILFGNGMDQILKGYRVQAFDFLLNNCEKEDVYLTLSRWVKFKGKHSNRVFVKKGRKMLKLNHDNVYYFIMSNHHIEAHMKDGVVKFKGTISNFEKLLPKEKFCRCHRSYVVNMKYIKKLIKDEITMTNGEVFKIAKSRIDCVHESIAHYFNINL